MSASVKESLQLQLLEMEMLFSMFPNQGEVKLEDVNALTNIKRYLEGTREALPHNIEFVITLQIEEPKVGAFICSKCFWVPTFLCILMCMGVLYACEPCACSAFRGQRRADLEVQKFVRHLVSTWNRTCAL